jgi:hypothetical protein
MSLAIVDAREWQNLLDLRTGKKAQDESPQTLMLRGILKRHPYPGDVDIDSLSRYPDTLTKKPDEMPGFFLNKLRQFELSANSRESNDEGNGNEVLQLHCIGSLFSTLSLLCKLNCSKNRDSFRLLSRR